MSWLNQAIQFIVETLLQEGIVVIFGVIIANLIIRKYENWRYGGWQVVVRDGDGKECVRREISAGKLKAVQAESADLSVYLKGVVSPYATLNCDILDKAQEGKLLTCSKTRKEYIVDLAHNPKRSDAARL